MTGPDSPAVAEAMAGRHCQDPRPHPFTPGCLSFLLTFAVQRSLFIIRRFPLALPSPRAVQGFHPDRAQRAEACPERSRTGISPRIRCLSRSAFRLPVSGFSVAFCTLHSALCISPNPFPIKHLRELPKKSLFPLDFSEICSIVLVEFRGRRAARGRGSGPLLLMDTSKRKSISGLFREVEGFCFSKKCEHNFF